MKYITVYDPDFKCFGTQAIPETGEEIKAEKMNRIYCFLFFFAFWAIIFIAGWL